MQWTTADKGNDSLVNPDPAQVGFNAGDQVNYFNTPESQTPAIINITQMSNVNVSGRWIFQIQVQITSPGTAHCTVSILWKQWHTL